MGFAESTTVSPEKTKYEIETTLRRYKATQFVSGWGEGKAFVMFKAKDRIIRFTVPMPDPADKKFTQKRDRHGYAKAVTAAQAEAAYQQEVRTRWRRLLLCIKAKLESVDSGIETFEEAFLAHIVVPGNVTFGEWAAGALPAAYATGAMPKNLLALPAANTEEADRG